MTLDHKSEASPSDLVALSAVIMAGYLRGNALPVAAIAEVIELIHNSLRRLNQPADPLKSEVQTPAVPVRKSVTDEYIVCLEDGRKLKMLRRHLRTTYGMTAEEYREKWNLPDNYPMVAPAYTRERSALARELGLGRKRFKPEPKAVPVRRAVRSPS